MKYFSGFLSLIFFIGSAPLVYADTKVFFSPHGGCQEAVVSEIGSAHDNLDIAMYDFTLRPVAQAVLEAKARGVKVRIVFDSAQIKEEYSKSRYLIKKGVDVRFKLGPGIMHNKFAIIDDQVVLTGSFNWTVSAEKKNSENLLVIKDKELAQKYEKQFKLLWGQSGEGGFKERPEDKE